MPTLKHVLMGFFFVPFNHLEQLPPKAQPNNQAIVEGLYTPQLQNAPYISPDFKTSSYAKQVLPEYDDDKIDVSPAEDEYIAEDMEGDDADEFEDAEGDDADEFEDAEGDDAVEIEDTPVYSRVSNRRLLGKTSSSNAGSTEHGMGGKGSAKGIPNYRAMPVLRGEPMAKIYKKKKNVRAYYQEKASGAPYGLNGPVGCGYLNRPCTTFYYPYNTYTSGQSYPYSDAEIYRHAPGNEDELYNWNIMSSLPYVAKSPIFGNDWEERRLLGDLFDDLEDSKRILEGKVNKVMMYGETYLKRITFEYVGGASVSHGAFIYDDGIRKWVDHGEPKNEAKSEIVLADGEGLVEATFSSCQPNGHRYQICGAKFTTTEGRIVTQGQFDGKEEYTTKTLVGFTIGGFLGKQGAAIHVAGLITVNYDALNAAAEKNAIPAVDGSNFYNTPIPGIAASYVIGGNDGHTFNMGFMLPLSIYEMRINKVSLYGRKAITGMTFTYDGGAQISIGKVAGRAGTTKPSIVDLGATGRIVKIVTTQKRVRKPLYRTRRIIGAIFTFIDKDGKEATVSRGSIDTKKYQHDELPIPDGADVIAPFGSQGGRIDNIGFFIHKSKTAQAQAPSHT